MKREFVCLKLKGNFKEHKDVLKLKTLDLVHDFGNNRTSGAGGICRVRCYINQEKIIVLLTDLGALNDGLSVTNGVEKIISSVIEHGIVTQPDIFI